MAKEISQGGARHRTIDSHELAKEDQTRETSILPINLKSFLLWSNEDRITPCSLKSLSWPFREIAFTSFSSAWSRARFKKGIIEKLKSGLRQNSRKNSIECEKSVLIFWFWINQTLRRGYFNTLQHCLLLIEYTQRTHTMRNIKRDHWPLHCYVSSQSCCVSCREESDIKMTCDMSSSILLVMCVCVCA